MRKIAIVCASSRGIGKAIALSLAKDNCNIVINGTDEESVNRTSELIRDHTEVLSVVLDITKKGAIDKLFERTLKRFGTVDILINNVGGPNPGRFIEKTSEDWQEAFDLLMMPFIKLTKKCIPIMQTKKWGRIVTVTSSTAKEPASNLILSNPFRAAIISISKSLSQEYAKDNVLITTVCPANVLSDRTEFLLQETAKKEGVSYEEIYNRIVEGLPMKRLQTTEEVASLVSFLCSDKASGITGTSINVDGGNSKYLF